MSKDACMYVHYIEKIKIYESVGNVPSHIDVIKTNLEHVKM